MDPQSGFDYTGLKITPVISYQSVYCCYGSGLWNRTVLQCARSPCQIRFFLLLGCLDNRRRRLSIHARFKRWRDKRCLFHSWNHNASHYYGWHKLSRHAISFPEKQIATTASAFHTHRVLAASHEPARSVRHIPRKRRVKKYIILDLRYLGTKNC